MLQPSTSGVLSLIKLQKRAICTCLKINIWGHFTFESQLFLRKIGALWIKFHLNITMGKNITCILQYFRTFKKRLKG